MIWRVFLLVGLMFLAGCGEQPLRVHERKPAAPALQVPLLGSGELSLDEWLGQPLVLNFWASWCPPCREEIPSMNRAWDRLGEQGIRMLAVNLGESQDVVEQFLKRSPIDFPVALDPQGDHTRHWPIRGLPVTYIIDPQGRVVYSATGPREWDDPVLLDKILALKN